MPLDGATQLHSPRLCILELQSTTALTAGVEARSQTFPGAPLLRTASHYVAACRRA